MSEPIQEKSWVWVWVQDPEGNEQFLGQHDDERDISFIPTFLEKEGAEESLKYLVVDKEKKYEIQAISYKFLASHAAKNGFMIFILNGAGEVLEKIET